MMISHQLWEKILRKVDLAVLVVAGVLVFAAFVTFFFIVMGAL